MNYYNDDELVEERSFSSTDEDSEFGDDFAPLGNEPLEDLEDDDPESDFH